MSELHERHSACELREQWIAERFWPVGAAAESLKCELIGLIVSQRIDYSQEVQQRIERIAKMLEGTFDPDKDIPKRRLPGPEEMKLLWRVPAS